MSKKELEKKRKKVLNRGIHNARDYALLRSIEYNLFIVTGDVRYKPAFDRGNERIMA